MRQQHVPSPSVIVGIDGSRSALNAALWAVDEAVRRDIPLRLDDCGYPIARDGSREPAVPPSELSEARTAVDLCPRLALSLITEADREPGNRKAGMSL